MFDNVNFYMFRKAIDMIKNDLEKSDEEDEINKRQLFVNLKRRVRDLQGHWNNFEKEWKKDIPSHNLEVLEEFGGTYNEDDNCVYWRSARDIHDHVTSEEEGIFDQRPNQFINIEVCYLEDEDTYHLEVEDDIYDLKIDSTKSDIEGIIAVLCDIASKFDFESIINMGQSREIHETNIDFDEELLKM